MTTNPAQSSLPGLPSPLPDALSSLGEPEAVYYPSPLLGIVCWGLGGLCVVGAIAVFSLIFIAPDAEGVPPFWGLLAISLVLVGIAVFVVQFAIRARGLCFLVFRDALVELKREHVQTFRWAEIKAVRESVRKVGNMYKITSQDGRLLVLDQSVSRVAVLGDTIQNRVTAQLLPEAVQMVQRGETVEFGPLAVSREALHHKGKVLPWPELGEFATQFNPNANRLELRVTKRGGYLAWP